MGGLGEAIGMLYMRGCSRAACIHVLNLVSHGVRGFPFLGVDSLVPIWSSRREYIRCIDDRASRYLGGRYKFTATLNQPKQPPITHSPNQPGEGS